MLASINNVRNVVRYCDLDLGHEEVFSWACERLYLSMINEPHIEKHGKSWKGDNEQPYWDLDYHMRYNYALMLATNNLFFQIESNG